jgi:hypothetical protein
MQLRIHGKAGYLKYNFSLRNIFRTSDSKRPLFEDLALNSIPNYIIIEELSKTLFRNNSSATSTLFLQKETVTTGRVAL